MRTARAVYRSRALDYALQVNVIEDKRKFDIMEFVSFRSSKDGEKPADSGREEGDGGVSFLSSAPAHLVH